MQTLVRLAHRRAGGATAAVRAFAADVAGQDVVEYGLILATIAVVVLLGTAAFGRQVLPWFEFLAGRITTTGT